jgi:hypothetical protein
MLTLLFSCLFFDLHAGKVLHGQVHRAAGSVDNIVKLVQRLSWILVVYGSSCTVGSRIVRDKSSKIIVILPHRKIGNPRTHHKSWSSYFADTKTESKGETEMSNESATPSGRAAYPLGTPPLGVGPSGIHRPCPFAYKFTSSGKP